MIQANPTAAMISRRDLPFLSLAFFCGVAVDSFGDEFLGGGAGDGAGSGVGGAGTVNLTLQAGQSIVWLASSSGASKC